MLASSVEALFLDEREELATPIPLLPQREGFALDPKGRFHKAKRLKERENPVRSHNKKRHQKTLMPLCCGERGIRTPGASQHDGFQDRCNRPLYHLSFSQ